MQKLLIYITLGITFLSCASDKHSSKMLEGSWLKKEQIIENGKDVTKERWKIWDPFLYEFTPDGKLLVSGGAEPLEPIEYQYTLIGDSTLHVYRTLRGNTLESHYSIIDVGNDTITLRCNASYIVFPDSVGDISSGGTVFLERVK